MAVHHVDVTGTPVRLPAGPAAPGGPVWVEIRPDLRRGATIASDLLAALGKRRDVAGVGRNAHHDEQLALAWLHAYDITALVATEAQRLSPLLLSHLDRLAEQARLPLWLLHRPPRSDTFVHGLQRRGAHPMRLAEVPTPQVRRDQPGRRPTLGVTLPPAPFHRFLTTCQAHLSSTDFQTVADRHAHTARHAYDTLTGDGTGIATVARLVEELLRPAPLDDLLTVDLRALQLACWHHDRYLKTDLTQLLASPERPDTDPTSVDQALVAYRQPHRPLAVALAAHQIGVTHIASLRIRDADTVTGTVALPDGRCIRLLEHSARALGAQLWLRTVQGADPDDPLLDVPERAISLALNDAHRDLRIRVHGRRAERHVHPRRWLAALGLTLHDLP